MSKANNKDKHDNIRDLHHLITCYVDNSNPSINSAVENFECAYQSYTRSPEDYVNSELAVASARSIIDAVLSEHKVNFDHNIPDSALHPLVDRLSPDQAQWMHKALNDIEEYRFWHMEHEFDDNTQWQ